MVTGAIPPARRPVPPVQLRAQLEAARREGLEWEIAWRKAMRSITWPHDTTHRRQWRKALQSTSDEWRMAYMNLPSRTQMQLRDLGPAVTLLADGLDARHVEAA